MNDVWSTLSVQYFQLIMSLSIKALFLNKSQAGDAYESDILFVRKAVAKRFCGSL